MRKVLVLLVLGMMVLQTVPFSVKAEGVDLEYTMIVTNPESHKANIELKISNIPKQYLNLTFYKLFDYFPHEVSNFNAISEKGDALKVNFSQIKGQRIWKINTKGNVKITIQYDLDVNYYYDLSGDEGYRGYLGKQYGMSMGAWTFIAPIDVKIDKIRVIYIMPKGWRAITPWNESGKGFEIDDFEYFITSAWAIGPFDTYNKRIYETNVRIAIFKNWDENLKEEIVRYSFEIFKYCRELFNKPSVSRYVAIYAPYTDDNKGLHWVEWTQAQGFHVDPRWDPMGLFGNYSHRIFHTWNGWPPFGINFNREAIWFIEGVNIYYDGDRIPYDLRYHISHSDMKYTYSRYLEDYYGTEWDLPVTEAWKYSRTKNNDKHLFINYNKGALISFVLNYEIRKRTNGNRNLNDLVRNIYSQFGRFGNIESGFYKIPEEVRIRELTNSDILKEINNLTNSDFSQFFNDYIYGTKKLELDEYFKDNDEDGITDIDEKYEGTNPQNKDTDGDGLLDSKELFYHTNPLVIDSDNDRLKDGDEIIKKADPNNPDTDGDNLRDGEDPHPIEREDVWKRRVLKESKNCLTQAEAEFQKQEYEIAKNWFIQAKVKYQELNDDSKVKEIEDWIIKCDEEISKLHTPSPPPQPQETSIPILSIIIALLLVSFREKVKS